MSALDREALELVDLCEPEPRPRPRASSASRRGALRVQARTHARAAETGRRRSWLGSKTVCGTNSSSSTARCSPSRPRASIRRAREPRRLRRARWPRSAWRSPRARRARDRAEPSRRRHSAYAVVPNPDGTVTVTISELVGVTPRQRKARRARSARRGRGGHRGLPGEARRVQLPLSAPPAVRAASLYETVGGARHGVSLRIDPARSRTATRCCFCQRSPSRLRLRARARDRRRRAVLRRAGAGRIAAALRRAAGLTAPPGAAPSRSPCREAQSDLSA